jgi:cytochrome c-type biogenesis protein CcmF
MSPGQSFTVESYTLDYIGPRMEVDNNKRMIFADLNVRKDGKVIGQVSPAKFIYKKSPESPTTEVSMLHSFRDDLYLIVGTINPTTKVATLQIHVNPLVSFIWFGCMILIFGSIVCMWPQLELEESRAWSLSRGRRDALAAATGVTLGLVVALWPAPAHAQSSSLHAGSVEMKNDTERQLFGALRCMCGGCERLPLSMCACQPADEARAELRAKLTKGESAEQIISEYQSAYGPDALTVPPNTGAMRAIYAVPIVAIFGGAVALGTTLKRWLHRPPPAKPGQGDGSGRGIPPVLPGAPSANKPRGETDAYDARLDEELKDLDD